MHASHPPRDPQQPAPAHCRARRNPRHRHLPPTSARSRRQRGQHPNKSPEQRPAPPRIHHRRIRSQFAGNRPQRPCPHHRHHTSRPQPAPHRGSRPPQHSSDLPMPAPSPTKLHSPPDHPRRIGPPGQKQHRQQHLGLPAHRATSPPRREPRHPKTTARDTRLHHPLPRPTPRTQHSRTPTTRTPQPALHDLGFHNRRVARYGHQQRVS